MYAPTITSLGGVRGYKQQQRDTFCYPMAAQDGGIPGRWARAGGRGASGRGQSSRVAAASSCSWADQEDILLHVVDQYCVVTSRPKTTPGLPSPLSTFIHWNARHAGWQCATTTRRFMQRKFTLSLFKFVVFTCAQMLKLFSPCSNTLVYNILIHR